MIRIAGAVLALTLASSALLSPPQHAGRYNRFVVETDPIDVGEADERTMLWERSGRDEKARSAVLQWSDAGRERPILVASWETGRNEIRWIYVQLEASDEVAWITAYRRTDYGEFPVTPLEGTRVSVDADELRFRIVGRHEDAEEPEVWRGVIARPNDG